MDGKYDICFSADGYEGKGHAILNRGAFQGFDGHFHLSGSVNESRGAVTCNVNVSISQHSVRNSKIDRDFTTQMTGKLTGDGFYLLGTGPLGVIVQIESTRSAW